MRKRRAWQWRSGGCYGPQGSSQHEDNGGGGNGHIGHGAGSASGYNGLGGGAAPHGDGKLSPAGMPQPEVAGLPSDHELHGAKDDKPWEKLLNEHLGAHFPAGDAGDHLEHKEAHESDHGLPSQHWDAHSTAGDSRDHPEHKEPHEGDHALLNQHWAPILPPGIPETILSTKSLTKAIASTNIFTKGTMSTKGIMVIANVIGMTRRKPPLRQRPQLRQHLQLR